VLTDSEHPLFRSFRKFQNRNFAMINVTHPYLGGFDG
jgi:hypothetical protein